jgi:type II secretory pathway pseudopilin PulG
MITMRRLLARAHRQDGITLAELLVSMSILTIVMTVFLSTLASMQRATVDQQVRSDLNDQARLALMSIDRQVRSGNLLYDPDLEDDPLGRMSGGSPATGYLFRVYTQARVGGSSESRCVLWLVDDQRRLLTRYWDQDEDPDTATEWRVAAEGVVNFDEDASPFLLDTEGRTVQVTLAVNPDVENRPAATQWFEVSLTGRNTSFGYPSSVCSELPSDMETET